MASTYCRHRVRARIATDLSPEPIGARMLKRLTRADGCGTICPWSCGSILQQIAVLSMLQPRPSERRRWIACDSKCGVNASHNVAQTTPHPEHEQLGDLSARTTFLTTNLVRQGDRQNSETRIDLFIASALPGVPESCHMSTHY